MPRIYSLGIMLPALGMGTLAILYVVLYIARTRYHLKPDMLRLLTFFGFLVIFLIVLTIVYESLVVLQRAAAVPYIQEALDEQCPTSEYTANTAGFSIGSGKFQWESADGRAICSFTDQTPEWQCICAP